MREHNKFNLKERKKKRKDIINNQIVKEKKNEQLD